MTRIEVPDAAIKTLFGSLDDNLRHLESLLNVRIRTQGHELLVEGQPSDEAKVERIVGQLSSLVREGVAWFSGLGVAPGEVDLLVSADYRAELPTGPLAVSAADPAVEVLVKNLGVATWTVAIASPIALSAHWHDAAGNVLVWDGPRTPLAAPVAPGGAITVKVALGPVPEGAASVTIDLVSEGLRWFGAGLPRPVTLGP